MYLIKNSLLFSTLILGFSRKFCTVALKNMSGETSTANKTCQTWFYTAGEHSVAYVTAPSEDVAKRIGRALVTRKLAACVNIVPRITSIFDWEDKVNEEEEVLMMIKTRTSKINQLTQYVRANHPYTVCEVISLPIQNGNDAYLKWISDVVPIE